MKGMPMPETEREQAFVALYERHYHAVFAYARRRTDEALARDAAAETFLVAWRHRGDVGALELPWLYRTAALVLKNTDRTERRQQRTAGRLAAEPPVVILDPADAYTDLTHVRQALDALSEQDRELLMLIAWEHLDTRGVATAIGRSPATTAVRLHRARRRFRTALVATGAHPPIASQTPLTPAHRKVSHESR
jgi:RNA polymerase sigma factor (sigma-70 family)